MLPLQKSGTPGTYCRTDEKNNLKLLEKLKSFPEPHNAKFVCAAVYLDSKNNIVTSGEIDGRIISEPRGTNGFGYDPLFLPEGFDKTTAELSPEIKNKISHRAKAFNKLKQLMKSEGLI